MIDRINITGIILAGGKSSRMGTDKGFVLWNSKPFIEHIIEALKPLVNEIIIVSDNSDYDSFGNKRVEDRIKDAGPLAGLYSGLYHSNTVDNLVLSCDVPLIHSEVLKALFPQNAEGYDIIQIASRGKDMPLIALYRKSCLDLCHTLLNEGERRLRVLGDRAKTMTINIASKWEPYVQNINTTEQLKDLQNAVEH